MKDFANKRGFTLIEILISSVVIGILLLFLVPTLLNAPSKSRDTKRINDIEMWATVLEEMRLEGVAYKTSNYCMVRGGVFDTAVERSYFGEGLIPIDPLGDDFVGLQVGALNCTSGGAYNYLYNPGGGNLYSFGIYGRLENKPNANTSCSTLIAQPHVKSAVVDGSDDYCYAVFVR
ncbi:hypothetical protein CVV38_01830 [Candidatus Peregrinibacteria bacterium HGW-Peregrinibacteria-1]|jgi:prepilin-type N-terminal cleavage/methylation domain-containing protein|nr:MAG: hypothetical protein CVV38_01830 [Candidatus Peregrinibacteria bacterium HGW-Peregrinibacteria-1]